MARALKPWAQADRDQFEDAYRDGGCTCFISPPCGYCTHPGHPLNQKEDDFWYEEEPVLKSLNAQVEAAVKQGTRKHAYGHTQV